MRAGRYPTIAKIVVATLATLVLANAPALRSESTPTPDLWMFPLPLGSEIDYQRNRESGVWGVFWQGTDGGSLRFQR
jgi:hypothetical protein